MAEAEELVRLVPKPGNRAQGLKVHEEPFRHPVGFLQRVAQREELAVLRQTAAGLAKKSAVVVVLLVVGAAASDSSRRTHPSASIP